MRNFKSFNLKPELISALNKEKYYTATDIQDLVIPKVLKNESLVVKSETGSGKTHSFLIPILNNIDLSENRVQALIISPTRELASQTYDFAKVFMNYFPLLNIKLISSSDDVTKSIEKIKTGPQIIISTCGRIKDILCDNSIVSLASLKTIVIDEADMALENGFIQDIDSILSLLSKPQILVFSATINKKLQDIFEKYINPDFFITTDNSGYTSKNVTHFAIDTKHIPVNECISLFLKTIRCYFLLIFVSEKKDIEPIYLYLVKKGFKVAQFHGDLLPRERRSLMKRIKNDQFQIVVCSDIASRGIDIPLCDTVLSIDLPNNSEFYFHRAGRSGRYDSKGQSYVFYDNDHEKKVIELMKNGVNFNFVKFGPDGFIDTKPLLYKKEFKNKKNEELDNQIKEVIHKTKKRTVKPNYKKKVKIAVEKVKQKHRREVIKKDIRKRRVERYKDKTKGLNE